MLKNRWILWAAVSSLPQAKKISNEDQLTLGQTHMLKHNGALIESLIVPGESRSIVRFDDACRQIEAYAKLEQHIQRKDFDVLGFLDRSRLGRTAALSMTVVAMCQEAGIVAYEYDNPPQSLETSHRHDDALIGAIKSVGAEQEIVKLKERHTRGMVGRTLEGKFANVPPYGYMRDKASAEYRIIINPAEAEAITVMADLFLAGRGQDAIAEELKARGFPTRRGGEWRGGTIYWMLQRLDRYAGIVSYDSKSPLYGVVKGEGSYPRILTRETVTAVQAEIASRSGNRKVSSDQCYVLSSICVCGVCGRHMAYRADRGGYLSCSNRHDGTRYVSASLIMEEFKHAISAMELPSAEELGLLQTSQIELLAAKMTSLEQNTAKVRKSLHVASTAFVDGIIDLDEFKIQKNRLNDQLAALALQRQQIERSMLDEEHAAQRVKRTEDFLAEALARLDGDDVRSINAWLRSCVSITVRDGHIESIDIF